MKAASIILFGILFGLNTAKAEVDPAIHDKCKSAVDYSGCVEAHKMAENAKILNKSDATNQTIYNKCTSEIKETFLKASKEPPENLPTTVCNCVVTRLAMGESLNNAKSSCPKDYLAGSLKEWKGASPEPTPAICEPGKVMVSKTEGGLFGIGAKKSQVGCMTPYQAEMLNQMERTNRPKITIPSPRQTNCTTQIIGNQAYTNCW